MKNITKNNSKKQQFRNSMQEHGIDIDRFQQDECLSSKILGKIVGGSGKGHAKDCHDRSMGSGPNHDRSHDKVHSKGFFHDRCDHPKK